MLYKLMPEVTAGLAMLAIFMVAADAAPIKKALAKPSTTI